MNSIKDFFYTRENNFKFFTKPTSIEQTNKIFLCSTRENSLEYKIMNGKRKSLDLNTKIKFNKKEYVCIIKEIENSKILIITNFMNIYKINICYEKNIFLKIHKCEFHFGSNLSLKSNFYRLIKDNNSEIYFVISKFVFKLKKENNSFSLFKIFNSEIIDIDFDKKNNEMIFLTEKKIISLLVEENGHKMNFQEINQNYKKLAFFGNNIFLLKNYSNIIVLNKNSKEIQKLIEIKKASNFFEIENIIKIKNTLIAYNENYLFIFDKNQIKVNQVLNIKKTSYLLVNDQLLKLIPKDVIQISILIHENYTKNNKNLKFYHQKAENKLNITFAYLTKKFLKLKEVKNFNKTIHNMLCELHLGKKCLQHPEFQKKTIEFFKFIKDFTSYKRRNKKKIYQIEKPDLICEVKNNTKIFDNKIKEKSHLKILEEKRFKEELEKKIHEQKIENHKKNEELALKKEFKKQKINEIENIKNKFEYHAEKNKQSSSCAETIFLKKKELLARSYKEVMEKFNPIEKKIIIKNMKKEVLISKNFEENSKIKYIRAQNSILRYNSGIRVCNNIINDQNLSVKSKFAQLFYFMEKFNMKTERLNLFLLIQNYDSHITIYTVIKDVEWEEKKKELSYSLSN